MTKIKFKKYFLSYLLCLIFLTNTNTVLAETSAYQNKGVQDTIKQYLCTPTDVSKDKNSKEVGATTGMGSVPETLTGAKVNPFSNSNSQAQQQQSEIQYNSGANNNARYDLYDCINKVYRFAIAVGSVFAVFFIVIAGYLYMSSDGSSESVDKAKSIIASSITAMVILFSGYILLKEINPDLIAFQNIQPPSVKLQTLDSDSVKRQVESLISGGKFEELKQATGGAGKTAQDFKNAGCAFQTPKQENEAPAIRAEMAEKLKTICAQAKQATGGTPPQISGVIGEGDHDPNSKHYLGCAIDFADGVKDGFFNVVTKQGRPIGVAIYNAAIAAGISESRINPGEKDRKQTFHIHIDLNCSK